MKNIFSLFIGLFCTSLLFAQAPNNLSYQATVRKSDGSLLTLTKVNFKFTILQTSNVGPAVYEETQSVNTNKDGSATLKIGDGTPVSGNFSTIDWSSGVFFIKTSIDLSGGSNFVFFTENQFSAVPYSFFANEAGSVNYSNVKNKPNVDSLQKLIVSLNALNNKLEMEIDSLAKANKPHFIGEHYGGGIVFFVYDNGEHGLIASTQDQTNIINFIQWSPSGQSNLNTYAKADGIGAGARNTTLIFLNYNNFVILKKSAASLCENFSLKDGDVIYSDWYLPSKEELRLLFLQKMIVGGFTTNSDNFTPIYWSSTEVDINSALSQSFEDGISSVEAKTTFCKVRAIRRF